MIFFSSSLNDAIYLPENTVFIFNLAFLWLSFATHATERMSLEKCFFKATIFFSPHGVLKWRTDSVLFRGRCWFVWITLSPSLKSECRSLSDSVGTWTERQSRAQTRPRTNPRETSTRPSSSAPLCRRRSRCPPPRRNPPRRSTGSPAHRRSSHRRSGYRAGSPAGHAPCGKPPPARNSGKPESHPSLVLWVLRRKQHETRYTLDMHIFRQMHHANQPQLSHACCTRAASWEHVTWGSKFTHSRCKR